MMFVIVSFRFVFKHAIPAKKSSDLFATKFGKADSPGHDKIE